MSLWLRFDVYQEDAANKITYKYIVELLYLQNTRGFVLVLSFYFALFIHHTLKASPWPASFFSLNG